MSGSFGGSLDDGSGSSADEADVITSSQVLTLLHFAMEARGHHTISVTCELLRLPSLMDIGGPCTASGLLQVEAQVNPALMYAVQEAHAARDLATIGAVRPNM